MAKTQTRDANAYKDFSGIEWIFPTFTHSWCYV